MNYILDNLNSNKNSNLNKNSKKVKNKHIGGAPNPIKNIFSLAGETNQKIKNIFGGMGNMTYGYGKYMQMYMNIPCMIYQNIANAVCRLSNTGMMSMQNLMPNSQNQVSMTPNTSGGNKDNELDENILNEIDDDDIDENVNTQSGGGMYNISIKNSVRNKKKYEYIVNPVTKRRVKLNSKKGQVLLMIYLNNFGCENNI